MDVAEQVAVIHEGQDPAGRARRASSTSTRRTTFVMGFIGPVTRLGDAVVRPHDVAIVEEPGPGTREALVERVAHLCFEVRVELTLDDGRDVWVQLTRAQAAELELEPGPDRLDPPERSTRPRAASPRPPGRRSASATLIGQLAGGDVGQRHVLEHRAQAGAQGDPHVLQRLGGAAVASLLGPARRARWPAAPRPRA